MKVHEETLDSAEKLFNFFSPLNSEVFSKGITSRKWLFRGVPEAEFELLPSALRPESGEIMNRIAGRKRVPEHASMAIQLFYEFNILAKFYAEVDAQGLPVADDAPSLRPFLHRPTAWAVSYLEELRTQGEVWPPKGIRGLAALAQHHGLPTRLLDWSYDPFVACYFACKSAGAPSKSEYAAVWAVDSYAIERSGGAVEIITAPAASNPNLHAQRGVFTVNPVILSEEAISSPVARLTVDMLLKHVSAIDSPLLYKVRIPKKEIQKVLSLLYRVGYKPSKLFPGYDGAAKAVRETCPFETDNWEARVTVLVPKQKLDIARAVSSLIDPDSHGHKTFVGNYILEGGDQHAYLVMSTSAPLESAPLMRKIAESIKGSVFFFQNARSMLLLDTNTNLEIGRVFASVPELIASAGFRSMEENAGS